MPPRAPAKTHVKTTRQIRLKPIKQIPVRVGRRQAKRSELFGTKGVASLDVPLIEAALEPSLPLFRRAVGKSLRHDIALRSFLQRVIADLRRRVKRLVQVTRVENAFLLGLTAPDAGEAVGLQLEADRKRTILLLARAAPHLVDLWDDAEQILNV